MLAGVHYEKVDVFILRLMENQQCLKLIMLRGPRIIYGDVWPIKSRWYHLIGGAKEAGELDAKRAKVLN